MGLYSTSYVIFGYHINKKQMKLLKDNPYEIEETLSPGIELVYDQVCSDYIVFGKKLHSTHEHEAKEITSIDIQTINPELATQLKDTFIEAFGMDVYDAMEHKEPQLLAFTHYS